MVTQLQLLSHDIQKVRASIERDRAAVVSALAGATPSRRRHLLVMADLLFRMLDLGAGFGATLAHHLYSSAVALQRPLLESYVNLRFIDAGPDSERLALAFAAYSHVKEVGIIAAAASDADPFPDPPDIPAEVMEAARTLVAKRNNWSGKPTRQMMEALSLDHGLYAFTSEESHARGVGTQARLVLASPITGTLHLGRALAEDEVELMANVARAMVLDAFGVFWTRLTGAPPAFATEHPARFSSGEYREPAA